MTRFSFSEHPDILVVIPAYNEAEHIGDTIASIRTSRPNIPIIVVDDGSTDSTTEIAAAYDVEIMKIPKNGGKGNALNRVTFGRTHDVWLFLDADLGHTAVEGLRLLDPILAGIADVVVGNLPRAQRPGGFGLVKRLGTWGIKVFTGMTVQEPLSGQRAMTGAALKSVGRFENGYGIEVGMTIDVIRAGFRFMEVPVEMSHDETGRDVAGFVHRGKQFLDVGKVILKRAFRSGR